MNLTSGPDFLCSRSLLANSIKRLTYILVILSFLNGCLTRTQQKNEVDAPVQDSMDQTVQLRGNTEGETEPFFYIKDSADYSPDFLNELANSDLKSVSLMDSFLILGPSDTVMFPQVPPVGKETVLSASNGDLSIVLMVKRINQTSIDYKMKMLSSGKESLQFEGQADISPYFYLGEETDENSVSGESYFSTEFSERKNDCYIHIRIGTEEGSDELLGKIKTNCNDDVGTIGLDDFPTLVEQDRTSSR